MPTPTQYLNSIEEPRRDQLKELHALIRKQAPKLKPWVLSSAHGDILGYGKYEYHTKSGCQGDWFTIGLANRKQGMALYICAIKNGKYLAEHYTKKLPKIKMGKSCLTIKKLEDVDIKVLAQLLSEAASLHGTMTHSE